MPRKRNEKEVKEIVENFDYVYLDSYMNKNYRRVIFQDKKGYKYDVDLNSLLSNHIPEFVNVKNPFTLSHNIPLWLKLNNSQFDLLDDNEYLANNVKLNLYCNKCKDYPKMEWSQISQGKGCGICVGKQTGIYHNLAVQFPDIAKEWHPTKNGNLTPKDVTYGSGKKIWWLCENGHEYFSCVYNRTGGKGCRKCNQFQSKGAKKIYNFLVKNNIDFEVELPVGNCKGNKKLKFDFYLIKENLAIEYDGHQHFIPVDFGGNGEEWAKQRLKENKNRDIAKTKYCKNNNINLLRIPYWEFDNIEKILAEYLYK